jgi:hypothetical protein
MSLSAKTLVLNVLYYHKSIYPHPFTNEALLAGFRVNLSDPVAKTSKK